MATNFLKIRSGITQGGISADPSSGQNGDEYYNTSLNAFRYRQNGFWIDRPFGGVQAIVNNQASPANVTGFLVDPADHLAFSAEYRINREHGGTVGAVPVATVGGDNDSDYITNLGTGFGAGGINAVTFDPIYGATYVGGGYTDLDGNTRNRMVKLFPDGTEDSAFYSNMGVAFNGTVNTIAVADSIGGVWVGGAFNEFNVNGKQGLVRLDSSGSEDAAVMANITSGVDLVVQGVAVLSDGRAVFVGTFSSFDSNTRNGIFCLNPDGTEDTTFYTNVGAGFGARTTMRITVDELDRIIIGGDFTSFDGNTRNRLIRLNDDGTEDATFYSNLGTGVNSGIVQDIKIDANDKILVVGTFTGFNSNTRNRIFRLNSNGTEDGAFYTNLGTAASSGVQTVDVEKNGRIVLGGSFANFDGALTHLAIIGLNDDGTKDTAFNTALGTGAGSSLTVIRYTSFGDGLYIGGSSLTTFNGDTVGRFLRVNAASATSILDSTFATNLGTGFNSGVYAASEQSDGKIIVAGGFTSFDGNARLRIVRLNQDGTEDAAFYSNVGSGFSGGNVLGLKVLQDDSIVAVGSFTDFNGNGLYSMVKLNPDGTEDTTFSTNIGTGMGTTALRSVAELSDGRILFLGTNNTIFNGNTRNRLFCLNPDGTEDVSFYTNMGTAFTGATLDVFVDSNDKIYVNGQFTSFNSLTRNNIVRLNDDGTEDVAFYTNLGSAFLGDTSQARELSDGRIVVVGGFSQLNGNPRERLVCLNADGTEDVTFAGNVPDIVGPAVNNVAVMPGDLIVISEVVYSVGNKFVGDIAVFNDDGTRNDLYTDSFGFGASGVNGFISGGAAFFVSSNGSLYAVGTFLSFDNDSNLHQIVRTQGSSTGTVVVEQGTLRGIWRSDTSEWDIGAQNSIGDDTGVDFSMTNGGQLQYTSSNIPDTPVLSEMKYVLTKL